MADNYDRKFPKRSPPRDTKRVTTGCQYCAVGCGYNAFLVPNHEPGVETETLRGISRFITPAMRSVVNFKGFKHAAAVAPDVRCDLNKGNHSVRGGSQGGNLVSIKAGHRSTADRITSPKVRLANGQLADITWADLNRIMAKLVAHATDMEVVNEDFARRIRVNRPEGLGVKIFEYQYLENTFAATKLFYSAIGTPNAAYHDRPSAAGSSPGMSDAGLRPHAFSYDEVLESDVLVFIGTNPYENHSVFFMQYCQGKRMIVIDPRKTATAQYAENTGGIHIQPKKLGADSILLYAIAREIIESWPHDRKDFPWYDRIASADEVAELKKPVPNENEKDKFRRMRRASRAANFDSFADHFLMVGKANSPYTLDKAAEAAGLDDTQLEKLGKAIELMFRPSNEDPKKQQSKVGMFYEKGMIWGFNYHNTAAVASLGHLLGAYSESGRFVGRVGGHQKGWAAAKIDLSDTFDNHRGTTGCGNEGYPFRNSEDRYGDSLLQDKGMFGPGATIKVHHNLDNHVFGFLEDFEHKSQDGVPRGFVRLQNNLVTKKYPDVRLLWIIGGNYLGQTNNAQEKQSDLMRRLCAGGGGRGKIKRPKKATVSEVVRALTERMDAGRGRTKGIVLIQQEIIPNPTTDLCDIIIPAAGWGEDAFCRYNAQRRLKLYDRIQDSPLDARDAKKIKGDPLAARDDASKYQHSPKPDWMIIRDVALAIGREMDGGKAGHFAKKLKEIFWWKSSSDVADDMARFSIRRGMLGALLDYGKGHGLKEAIVHTVLGKGGGGLSDYLKKERNIDEDGVTKGGYRVSDSNHDTYGNGIASNGVMLPVKFEKKTDDDGTQKRDLVGRLRHPPSGLFTFVKASWKEINPFYKQAVPKRGELFVTNGRFNHLWNNMFHHLRNEYVNERYPEDLPGTILEVNRTWAGKQRPKIEHGDVVCVKCDDKEFTAVASLQDSVPENGCFAMFSYPSRDKQNGDLVFNFNGYVNNLTLGYADGIVPIGALKYGRAVVKKVGTYLSPRLQHPAVKRRLGPTYEPRNVIAPATFDGDRAKWEMRERIVRVGLPRAYEHGGSTPSRPLHFLSPDSFIQRFVDNVKSKANGNVHEKGDRSQFLAALAGMVYFAGVFVDRWTPIEAAAAEAWMRSFDPEGGSGDGGSDNGGQPQTRFEKVVGILNAAVGGPTAPVGFHGPFWRDKTRDQFVAIDVGGFGETLPLLIERDGANSNLVKALKGEAPFGSDLNPPPAGARYRRMPAGRDPASPADIQFIQTWIDDGCPEDLEPTSNGDTIMARETSFQDHIVHMFRPIDVTSMAGFFNLEDYDEVKANADKIIDRISRDENAPSLMPPKNNGGPWPNEWIDLFKRWKDEGFPQ